MTIHAYLFEAKSIQSYIFSTNKLKEIVGGSELIEQLTSKKGLVNTTLQTLGLDDIELSRCGGAAFYAFSKSENSIHTLSQLWPLLFRQYAPDMEFIHAVGSGVGYTEAADKSHTMLMADRNRPKPRLPQANVYTRRFGRTGEPVVKVKPFGGDRPAEARDQVTVRKLAFKKPEGLVKRVLKGSSSEDWPINLTPEENDEGRNFPFKGQSRLIGLVHADGNGLGQLLMNLKKAAQSDNGAAKLADDDYVKVFKLISEAIQKATEDAAELAVKQVLLAEKENNAEQLFPARPIVLGGDDLTMIVRADLALPFTEAFLNAFEETSRQVLTVIKKQSACKQLQKDIPDYLTACAGIVYAKSSQPFSLLHELAEGLCKQAKKVSKANKLKEKEAEIVPSSISFYRVTSSLTDTYSDILKNELTFGNTQLSRTCFTTKPHPKLPELSDLLSLQALLEGAEGLRGALRQIVGLLHQSRAQAIRRYKRLAEVMEERSRENQEKQDWERFTTLLVKLSQDRPTQAETATDKQNEFVVNFDKAQDLPIEDVLSLIAVENKHNNAQSEEAVA